MDLQELIAREQIRDVKARYCRLLDTKDWQGFAALFTEDAILDVSHDTGASPHRGRDAIVTAVRWAVDHAKSAHYVHSAEFHFHGPDAADVIWAMHDHMVWEAAHSPIPPATGITGYGHYREHYLRQDGTWRIASLTLTRTNVELQH